MTQELVAEKENTSEIVFQAAPEPQKSNHLYTRVCSSCGKEEPACYIVPYGGELTTQCCDAPVNEKKNPVVEWGWMG